MLVLFVNRFSILFIKASKVSFNSVLVSFILLVLCPVSAYLADVDTPRGNLYGRSGKNVALGALKHHVFVYKLYDETKSVYKAFCSGNIIREKIVLSSSHCYLSNRKRYNRELRKIRLIAGTLHVVLDKNAPDKGFQQWRKLSKIYSQKYYRFPAYSLALLEVDEGWNFNGHVNSIPIASINQDFDGICSATAVRTMTSWKSSKVLFIEDMQVIPRDDCEDTLQRTCKLYYCTAYAKADALAAAETEGGGLICHGTGDPEEVDERGILVGVTTLINVELPTLHNRVGLFRKWIDDSATTCDLHKSLLTSMLILVLYFQ